MLMSKTLRLSHCIYLVLADTSQQCEFFLQVALYTVCFLLDTGSKHHFQLDEYDVEVTVYGHAGGIGTAYPTSLE